MWTQGTRRWVVIGTGVTAAAGLAAGAFFFGLEGVEAASWIAGVASLVVAVAAFVLAPGAGTPAAGDPAAARSVTVTGDVGGIVSIGDNATNTQQR
ncbi:hypothetical protein AB0G04_43325 [Actinoplanes sp. NPDC023801]|uniref:hypothetical protein n=1 Tax=Actinoplanes sp. NPDC023801 TaxID=3154595 RepID=UPI0033CD80D6